MIDRKIITLQENSSALTAAGEEILLSLGIPLQAPVQLRRPLVKTCLDWTERRYHLSGVLGKNMITHLFNKRWIVRQNTSRAVTLTALGKRELHNHFRLFDFLAS